ncbi:hypothetical protein ACHWQZ_G008151 [Mnemiopsis leidyi]
MSESTCFKCNMCAFLVKENEKLRDQLFELSISTVLRHEFTLLDKETQTSTPNPTVEHVGVNTSNFDDSGENQNLVQKLDASSNTSLYDNYQENTNIQTVISFDNHDTIVSKLNFVHSTESETQTNCSQMFNQPYDKPYTLIAGEPFSEFNVNKLTEATKFTAIGQRLVKYYGEFSYSYGNNKHPPCPIPVEGYLAEIVEKVRQEYPFYQFNSVLVTKYADGHSHLPMHSDDELDIADNSHILTVSLGASRTVNFQRKMGGDTVSLPIKHGQVFVMSAESQNDYRHGIPRDFGKKLRVSLTFRNINPPSKNIDSITKDGPAIDQLSPSQASVAEFLDSLSAPSQPTATCIDTLFISSSMFRHLKETELQSKHHKSKVLFYPGATAGEINNRLKSDPSFKRINATDIKKIYLLCGTNNVDHILGIPKTHHSCIDVDQRNFDKFKLEKSFVEIENLVSFLKAWSPEANLNIINILPRENIARNNVINELNGFLYNVCRKNGHSFINTELSRCMFSTRMGLRKCQFFHVNGSDNVHLNGAGIIKLGIITILKDAFLSPANISVSDEKLIVSNLLEKLKYSLSFNWEFELSPCTNTVDEIFNPIFTTMMLLIEEKNALESLIKKKDKEISVFKSLGINLPKKSKLSAPYDQSTLKNITASTRSTQEILSNAQFKEVVCKSYESEHVTNTRSPTKKKKLAPVGITFEDSQSQPNQVFTDDDIFPTVNHTSKDDHVSEEIEEDEVSTKVEEDSHPAQPALPVMKKKKPRRL